MSSPDTLPASKAETGNLNYFQKVWLYRRNLNIEPLLFLYFMGSVLNYIALLHFPADKACRVNLGYSKEVCDATLDKAEYNIDCKPFNFENATEFIASADEIFSADFNYTVCKAEGGAQKLIANVNAKRSPIANFFPLIVLLFAGGWSDRYNKRKACMLLPVIGEFLSFVSLSISAIFFEQIPMEFGAYAEAIVPALFGGNTLCYMAIDSYMTLTTPEEDRIFRFGIYAMFGTLLQSVGFPVSGYLLKYLGYVLSFGMAATLNFVGILYIIFVLKEPKSSSSEATTLPNQPAPCLHTNGLDNRAYEVTNLEELPNGQKNVVFEMSANGNGLQNSIAPSLAAPENKNCLKEFFDLTLVVDYVKFPFKKRSNRGRMLLAVVILACALTVIQIIGEGEYPNRFAMKELNWNGNDQSFYSTFSSLSGMAGTFIGTAILSKLLKLSDPMVGIISAFNTILAKVLYDPWFIFALNYYQANFPRGVGEVGHRVTVLKLSDPMVGIISAFNTILAKVLYAFSTTTAMFCAATAVDSFISMKLISIKSIGSSIVDEEELSKLFSIYTIFQPISGIIFTPIYSIIYENTVNSFPGAIFLFSEVFAIPSLIVFIICYFVLKIRLNKIKNQEKVDDNQNNNKAEPNKVDVNLTSF